MKIKRSKSGNNFTTLIKKDKHGGLKKLVLADFLFKDKSFIEGFVEVIKLYQEAGSLEFRNIVFQHNGRYELCHKLVPLDKKGLNVSVLGQQETVIIYEEWTTFVKKMILPKQLVKNKDFAEAVSRFIRNHKSENPMHFIAEDVFGKSYEHKKSNL